MANKYGGSQRIRADVGIVYLSRGPVVIAGFTLADDISADPGRETLARMSRLAIAALDPAAVVELSGRR